MDILQPYDVNIGEVPPVPAPRHKRKIIINEDSRAIVNSRDTSVNVNTVNIVPPPRRKNKVHCILNPHTFITNSKEASDSSLRKETKSNDKIIKLTNNMFSTSSQTKDIAVRNIINSTLEADNLLFSFVNTKEVCDTMNNISTDCSKISPISGEPKPNHKFDSITENRVLDTSLDTFNTSRTHSSLQKQCGYYTAMKEEREENRVSSHSSDNSATIVGVFYKPKYSLQLEGLINKDATFNTTSKELSSTHGFYSRIYYGNKTAASVSPEKLKKLNEMMILKDSEENDSGVYFSDTKSPPHLDAMRKSTLENEEVKSQTGTDYNPFPYKLSDTIDNKTSEELGPPQDYRVMLDSFEGQTVKAFREEIVSQFHMCDYKANQKREVEDWLPVYREGLEKKESSLSLYLKSMLESVSITESISPYPLSTVDEDERSDTLSEELKESNIVDEFLENKSVPQAYTISSSVDKPNDRYTLAPNNNNVNFDVDISDVNIFPVNIYPCVIFDEKEEIAINCTSGIKESRDDGSNKNQSIFLNGFENGPLNLNKCSSPENILKLTFLKDHSANKIDQDYLCTEHIQDTSTETGTVTSLIDYFEQTNKKAFVPSFYHCSQSEDEFEQDPFELDDNVSSIQETMEFNSMDCVQNPISKQSFKENPTNKTDINEYALQKSAKLSCSDESVDIRIFTHKINVKSKNDENSFAKCNAMDISCGAEKLKSNEYSVKSPSGDENGIGSCVYSSFSSALCPESIEVSDESKILNNQELLSKRKFHNFVDNNKCDSGIVYQPVCSGNRSSDVVLSQLSKIVDSLNTEAESEQDLSQNSLFSEECIDFVSIEQKIMDDANQLNNCNICELPNSNASKKISSCSSIPTRIPIVVLSNSDSSTIGSVELYSPNDIFQSNEDLSIDITDVSLIEEEYAFSGDNCNNIYNHSSYINCQNNEFPSTNSFEVALEKNWGSVGLKIEADENGLLVSDVLAGGAADQIGLVFKGRVSIKEMKEEVEIVC